MDHHAFAAAAVVAAAGRGTASAAEITQKIRRFPLAEVAEAMIETTVATDVVAVVGLLVAAAAALRLRRGPEARLWLASRRSQNL